MEFELGKIGASVILSIILRLIYNTWDMSNRLKPWIAIAAGVGLGILAVFYTGDAKTFPHVVDHVIQGFMVGATAVGLYELTKKTGA